MILLDTHAWIWHIGQPAGLSEAARRRIDQEETADRTILATAVELGVPVVSKDARFHDYQATEVIW